MKNNFIPRPEFPNPQFEREAWMNLNGEWDFEFDFSDSGREREMQKGERFSKKIIVPFALESRLSGIAHTDFVNCVWYARDFDLPAGWSGARTLLHFGAVDYFAEVWLNEKYLGFHRGGSSHFYFDITPYLKSGANKIVLRAHDDTRAGLQPVGKQCCQYHSRACSYTRVSGIWQTVWLEHIESKHYIREYRINCEPQDAKAFITVSLSSSAQNARVRASAYYNGELAASALTNAAGTSASLVLEFKQVELWSVGDGKLYDLVLEYETDRGTDKVKGYFGMRKVAFSDNALYINSKPVFMRLVLDQGYYPDGIWTAPSDDALKKDIELSLKAGFNGARFHQKVFEPRSLYWADKLGYIVWGESASWGFDLANGAAWENFASEWPSIVSRDINHPCVIGWCPLNETRKPCRNESLLSVYELTKLLDPSRPVIDTSGYIHYKTDIFDVHMYEQDAKVYEKLTDCLKDTHGEFKPYNPHTDFDGQITERLPYFISEYGGVWWNPLELKKDTKSGWGYGERPAEIEEVYRRIESVTRVILANRGICGFCYTQLTDIEQEQNGIYNYDRSEKFDMQRLRRAFSGKAAIEE